VSLSERVRRHLQSHVVAYIALFVALSGSALALPGKNSVKSNDIKRFAVKGRAIAEGAVKRAKIRDAAVTAPKLSAAAVTGAALADNAVTAPKLAEDSVTRQKIVQGSINGGKLANGSVNSAKVRDGTLLGEDFAPGQLSDGFAFSSPGGLFSIQRAGRVFVTVTFVATCAGGGCTDNYEVRVDGAAVPGTVLEFDQSADEEQITLVGLTAPLAAGAHGIELVDPPGGAEAGQVTLAGILLQ
jgi:hypothetical protein